MDDNIIDGAGALPRRAKRGKSGLTFEPYYNYII
jgi:hypothetical protein